MLKGRVRSGWTFAIDRGGTFTDVIARSAAVLDYLKDR